jgi:membrane-associated HD superfamily phosphohydrolase
MDLTQVIEALQSPEILTGVTSHILESEKGKEILTNKAEALYATRIGDEVNKIHSSYDNDMFEVLGEKPSAKADGTKEKTYEKAKSLFAELADLRKKKDSLTKEAEVTSLMAQLEDLKKSGGGAHWEKTFNAESEKWKAERETILQRAQKAESDVLDFKKRQDIEKGLQGLQFNENVPESARKAMVEMTVGKLMASSKIENGKVIYVDANGAQINDSEYKAQSSENLIKLELKDILKQVNNNGGGGADTVVKGSVQTQIIDGKDVKKLILVESQFKNKVDFQKTAEKALLDTGVTRGSKDWNDMLNEAYGRYSVKDLPRS